MLLNFDSSEEKFIVILLWSLFHLGFKHVSLIFKETLSGPAAATYHFKTQFPDIFAEWLVSPQ